MYKYLNIGLDSRFYVHGRSVCIKSLFHTKSIVFMSRTEASVLMSSIETDEADRSPVSRPGTEPVSSSLPPTRSAVMVPAPASHQNLFPY